MDKNKIYIFLDHKREDALYSVYDPEHLPENEVYHLASKEEVTEADWIAETDIDCILVLRDGEFKVNDFLELVKL